MIQDIIFLCILIHLFLEHDDIINNWSICLRIIITLIKESKNKNKVVLSLKKNHSILKKTKWANNSLITFKNFKGWKGNYCLSMKKQFLINFTWLISI